jgi:hypothetical protein
MKIKQYITALPEFYNGKMTWNFSSEQIELLPYGLCVCVCVCPNVLTLQS